MSESEERQRKSRDALLPDRNRAGEEINVFSQKIQDSILRFIDLKGRNEHQKSKTLQISLVPAVKDNIEKQHDGDMDKLHKMGNKTLDNSHSQASLRKAADTPPSQQADVTGPSPVNPAEAFLLGASDARCPHFFVRENFLGRDHAASLREAGLALHVQGKLQVAGMGKGLGYAVDRSKRGDSFLWIDPRDSETPTVFRKFSDTLKKFVHGIAKLQPSLNLTPTTSMQLALYPGDGTGYVRHRDAFKPQLEEEGMRKFARKITCLYYLNSNWEESHGGKLRIYIGSTNSTGQRETHFDIEPRADTLVIFRSDLVDHEVLPSFQPRLAVTCWFHTNMNEMHSKGEDFEHSKDSGEKSAARELQRQFSSSSDSVPQYPRLDYGPATADDNRSDVPPLPIDGSNADAIKASIFVSIASYRDTECQHTVVDLLERAHNPFRVFVGVVHQVDMEGQTDKECFLVSPPKQLQKQVRSIFIHYTEAKGPCWARHLAQSLWQGETYFLQLDSHMRFRPNWDIFLVETLLSCPSSDPVLTAYPPGYTLPHKMSLSDLRPTLLCPKEFVDKGRFLTSKGRRLKEIPNSVIPSPLWAAGFSFSRSDVVSRVPYDPFLEHIFFGEEISMAARMWTEGYDFFAPPEIVIFHLWSRAHRPSFRQVKSKEQCEAEECSKYRILQLLGRIHQNDYQQPVSLERFGLGKKRNLTNFWELIGIASERDGRHTISSSGYNANLPPETFLHSFTQPQIDSLIKMIPST